MVEIRDSVQNIYNVTTRIYDAVVVEHCAALSAIGLHPLLAGRRLRRSTPHLTRSRRSRSAIIGKPAQTSRSPGCCNGRPRYWPIAGTSSVTHLEEENVAAVSPLRFEAADVAALDALGATWALALQGRSLLPRHRRRGLRIPG